jgi:hypothetical protein
MTSPYAGKTIWLAFGAWWFEDDLCDFGVPLGETGSASKSSDPGG